MKQVITFLLILISIFFIFLSKKIDFLCINEGKIQFFLNNYSNCEINSILKIKNGSSYILEGDIKFEKMIENQVKEYQGKTYIFSNKKMSLKDVLNYYNVKIVEQNDKNNYVGYTTKFDKAVCIKNKKVNIQVLEKNDLIYVGTPILLGSY